MIYQHPLAYLLGLEGIALLHAFAGEYGRDFTEARLSEVRALPDSRRTSWATVLQLPGHHGGGLSHLGRRLRPAGERAY